MSWLRFPSLRPRKGKAGAAEAKEGIATEARTTLEAGTGLVAATAVGAKLRGDIPDAVSGTAGILINHLSSHRHHTINTRRRHSNAHTMFIRCNNCRNSNIFYNRSSSNPFHSSSGKSSHSNSISTPGVG